MKLKQTYPIPESVIREKIESLSALPVLDSFAEDVLQLLDEPTTTTSNLLRVVETNPVLSAKILKTANSPVYGFPQSIATVEFAFSILGFDIIKETIVLSLLSSRFEDKTREDVRLQQIWEHALATAIMAKKIARDVNYPVIGEAFSAGLFHDIGYAVIFRLFQNEFEQLYQVSLQQKSARDFSNLEESFFGKITHQIVGAYLLEKWNLPASVCEAVKFHHEPVRAERNLFLASIVHCADIVVRRDGSSASPFDENIIVVDSAVDFLKQHCQDFEVRYFHQTSKPKVIKSVLLKKQKMVV
ncbi:MAG: HDOD domain-containing protein [Ignavibacteriales bacterium]|nr:HDOD domain-containing protein [Ignavibacteriales bacterium]